MNAVTELNSTQRQHIRYDCLYLKKTFEVALQHMNICSWGKCIAIAISKLSDAGLKHIKSEKLFED